MPNAAWFHHDHWKEHAAKEARKAHYLGSLDPDPPREKSGTEPLSVSKIGGLWAGKTFTKPRSSSVTPRTPNDANVPSFGKPAFEPFGPVGLPSCSVRTPRPRPATSRVLPFAYNDHRGARMWGYRGATPNTLTPGSSESNNATGSGFGGPAYGAFVRGGDLGSALTPGSTAGVINAPKGMLGIGFDDNQRVVALSSASPLQGLVRQGDQLKSINGRPAEGMSGNEIADKLVDLRGQDRVLDFGARSAAAATADHHDSIGSSFKIRAPTGPLGLAFDENQTVTRICASSPLAGRVRVPDKLISINGILVEGLCNREIALRLTELNHTERILEFSGYYNWIGMDAMSSTMRAENRQLQKTFAGRHGLQHWETLGL
eukprot:TRINITY_DN43984_c0_g1_i1.p1 TRINITY_DN43984_c0_g1~~TRINITY_DN43984_c0_g1_i1.p1  ORF type:complete len:399 (-),score=41.00 TRINITY_DN43984_c0_g1_i1:39-1160(-)